MDTITGALGLADLCIKYGTILVNVCKSYQSADQAIREAILKIEAHWLKIQHQLIFLRKLWPSLDEEYQIHQNTVLQLLQGKVMAATALVDGLIGEPGEEASTKTIKSKKGEARSAKYAVWKKSSLERVLADLKDWSEVFDMSWFLITLQSGAAIDRELGSVQQSDDTSLSMLKDMRSAIKSTADNPPNAEKESVFLSQENLGSCVAEVKYSSAELWRDAEGINSFLVDHPTDTSTIVHICNLAKRLRNVEPMQFGILQCRGVLKWESSSATSMDSYRFVFSVPNQVTKPQSLRSLVLSGIGTQALDDRFSLARQLAKAVMFVHSAGFVHKNIRPDTVLILRDDDLNPHAALTGFVSFRLDEGRSLLQGDGLWETNLYRHPTRQGTHLEEMYSMQHDIYSLGVCLLEIGIGESLVLFEASDARELKPVSNSLLSNELNPSIKGPRKMALETKRALVKIAGDRLPATMGRAYTEITLTCLACLDNTDNSFGPEAEFRDENGVLVGVRFVEKILIALLDIKL